MGKKSSPTIKHVAESAGVSTTTVSRYLAGQRVGRATDVQKAISELGYRPSPMARALKSGVTRTIGVVVPDIANPYFSRVVRGIGEASRVDDYNVVLCNSDEDVEREHKVLTALRGRVDGIILTPVTERAETAERLLRLGTPIVLLDRTLAEEDAFDAVLVDNYHGAYQAGTYLVVSLGHQRVGFISGPLNTTSGRGRYEGFRAALEDAGLGLSDSLVEIGDFREETGYQCTLRLLTRHPPLTAIFSANNLMTIGALRAVRDLGVRIPLDLSLLGFDDLDFAELTTPPVTVIDRPMKEQGALAMRLLMSRLGGRIEAKPRTLVMDTQLKVRGSCASPAERTNESKPDDGAGTRHGDDKSRAEDRVDTPSAT